MLLTVTYPVLPKRNSVRASLVMDHFGISHDTREHVLARDLDVPLQPGDVVLFTGASGSGKSSLLRAVLRQLNADSQGGGEDAPRRHGGTEKDGVEAAGVSLQTHHSKIGLVPNKPSPSVPPCLRASVVNPIPLTPVPLSFNAPSSSTSRPSLSARKPSSTPSRSPSRNPCNCWPCAVWARPRSCSVRRKNSPKVSATASPSPSQCPSNRSGSWPMNSPLSSTARPQK